MPQGGHSKSPNSSNLAGAVSGPRVCGGSAPGTPVITGAFESVAAAPFRLFVTGVTVFVERFFKAHALTSATPRTQRMMIKGSIRFIGFEVSSLNDGRSKRSCKRTEDLATVARSK